MSFGLSGAAVGIVSSGLSTFVLLYYNMALGLSAGLVGTALAISLVFDAISDPLVGFASDKFRSRWGRRHPFMYVAILPVSALVYFLWNPPYESLDEQGLFIYLVAIVVPLRLLLTFFDVPSNALTPELTKDYDERTRLSTYRMSANWAAVTVFAMLLYGYWLRETPDQPEGLLNISGYQEMGFVSAITVGFTMLVCAVGLHSLIPRLPQASATHSWSIRGTFRGLRNTFSEPALFPLLMASILISSSFTIYGSLVTYLYSYFWELTTPQISGLVSMWGVGIAAGFFLTPILSRGRDKRNVAMILLVLLALTEVGPVTLNLLGAFPAQGSPIYYPLILAYVAADMGIFVMLFSVLSSMMADVAEKRQLVSGDHEEGVIYSAQTLISKASGAVGVWTAGLILEWIDFPTGARPDSVSPDASRSLALSFVMAILIFYPLGLLLLSRFRIDRAGHASDLERLERRVSDAEARPDV